MKYKQLLQLVSSINAVIGNQESKTKKKLFKLYEKVKKHHEDYQAEVEILRLDNASTDDKDCLLLDDKGNYKFSKEGIKKLTKDIDQEIEDKPNIFDYQSSHIVVRPLESDNNFSTELINSLTCEIQIRTLLQHAFAEVSHDSTYKGPYKNDKEILRRLAKAMAFGITP